MLFAFALILFAGLVTGIGSLLEFLARVPTLVSPSAP